MGRYKRSGRTARRRGGSPTLEGARGGRRNVPHRPTGGGQQKRRSVGADTHLRRKPQAPSRNTRPNGDAPPQPSEASKTPALIHGSASVARDTDTRAGDADRSDVDGRNERNAAAPIVQLRTAQNDVFCAFACNSAKKLFCGRGGCQPEHAVQFVVAEYTMAAALLGQMSLPSSLVLRLVLLSLGERRHHPRRAGATAPARSGGK